MERKTHTRSILSGLALAAVLMLVGCTEESVYEAKSVGSELDESDITDAVLGFSVSGFSVSGGGSTRAEEPSGDEEVMSDFEKQIDNIWVFQYGSADNLLIRPRYYTAAEHETDGAWSVVLKANIASKVYVVANVNSGAWASDSGGFMTVSDLMAATLPEPYTIYDLSEDATEGHIPMQGHLNGVTVGSGDRITVPVERMYAKVKVRVIIDKLLEPYDPSIYSVYAENCPWYCRIGTLYDNTLSSMDKEYGQSENDWITRSMMTDGEGNNVGDPNNAPLEEADEPTYDYVIYLPENIQGEVTVEGRDANAKADNLPSGHPTSVVVDLKYTNTKGAESEAHYTVYPGGNSYNNFNIRRNQVYRVTMTLGSPETEHTPSANCLVAHPGKTISFEPYYRVETGGGYDFLGYISPNSEEGAGKQISKVKILWQTEDCIGDNSNGDLVYFEASEPEQDLHDKIYVTANAPGNAVIAAYDDDPDTDSNAEIIWSWHIWVTSEDPTNISNAVTYYTYQWDSDGIYGEGSGKSRVPGYGMMSCNLGALVSVPTANSVAGRVATFGLAFQWGRKDPFPGLKGSGIDNTLAPDNIFPYDNDSTEQLYDNSHNEVNITGGERTELNELFYTISGTEIEASNLGLDFSIKNPTVFMGGTYEVGATGSSAQTYIRRVANYHNSGDWLAAGQSDDRLWGQSETATKYIVVGTDGTGEDRHMYDDYGEKSIFDPCPYGWRVSPPDQWLGFTYTGLNPSSMDEVNYYSSQTGSAAMALYIQSWRSGLISYFPTQGMRCPNGQGSHNRSCGNYHNATTDTYNRVNILHIHNNIEYFKIFEMTYLDYYQKSVAGPIRCVRDTK